MWEDNVCTSNWKRVHQCLSQREEGMLHLDSFPYVQTARDAIETSVQNRNLGEVFSCDIYLYNQHFLPTSCMPAHPLTRAICWTAAGSLWKQLHSHHLHTRLEEYLPPPGIPPAQLTLTLLGTLHVISCCISLCPFCIIKNWTSWQLSWANRTK